MLHRPAIAGKRKTKVKNILPLYLYEMNVLIYFMLISIELAELPQEVTSHLLITPYSVPKKWVNYWSNRLLDAKWPCTKLTVKMRTFFTIYFTRCHSSTCHGLCPSTCPPFRLTQSVTPLCIAPTAHVIISGFFLQGMVRDKVELWTVDTL